jgi:predicted DNA-binding transcriptional regulator YafY
VIKVSEKQPKKKTMFVMNEILNKYTDVNHTLTQKEIQDIMENEYSLKVERRAVKRNLMNLVELNNNVYYGEKARQTYNKKSGEYDDTDMMSHFYIERDFSDAELSLLIDSIVFSSHIPQGDKMRLIEKLEGLSNIYFKSRMKHVTTAQSKAEATNMLFYTVDILDEAISEGKQVKFHYDEYGTDKMLHHRKRESGEVRDYIISPYNIAATNGRYYLICNYQGHEDISNYRLDRISDIEILETNARPIDDLPDGKNFDLSKYMKEHIYMFSDETVRAKFNAKKTVINDIMDFFGNEAQFSNETDDDVMVTVKISKKDMELFAMQFATEVTVTEPADLAEQCKNNLFEAAEKYKEIVK